MFKFSGKIIKWVVWVVLSALISLVVNHAFTAFYAVNYMVGGIHGNLEVNTFNDLMQNNFFFIDMEYGAITLIVFVCLLIVAFAWSMRNEQNKKFKSKKGIEHGSARWATTSEMQDFKAKQFEENFLLSKNSAISIPKIQKTKFQEITHTGVSDRNKHILVVGGSGAGKTFNVVGPNILQAEYSYISTDPKGDTVKKYGPYLLSKGYKLKIVNIKDTEDFEYSFRYNPFHYITDQASIMNLVSIIIENTSGSDTSKSSEDFWIKSERCLYMCLIAYIYYRWQGHPEYQTIPVMLDMIELASASEQDETAVSPLDIIMEDYEQFLIEKYGDEETAKVNPEWFVLTQYRGFKKAAGETAKSIIISCFVRLAPFSIGAVRDMFSADELELEKLGEEKTALFLVMSDTNKTFNFILAMILYQLFDINVKIADKSKGSHCKIPVMCILDEMANIGRIPDMKEKIATLRSRWINLVPILQSTAQLDAVYGKDESTIIKANCDTFLYLGRGDYSTCEEISKQLGTETIETVSVSQSRTGSSKSISYQGRELMKPDELYSNPEKFADDECLVMIKMAHPYRDKKYMLFDHPHYAEFKNGGDLNIEDYVMTKRADTWRQQQREKEQANSLRDTIREEYFALFDGVDLENVYMLS